MTHTTTAQPEPDVSVVVPTFNRSAVLERCLTALAAQTHRRFEVVVVDDTSTDGTIAMLERLAASNAALQLRWFVNDRNAGANFSRNRGTREARGLIVAFLDSDCVAEPDWLVQLMSGFSSDRVAAVTGLVLDPPVKNLFESAFRGTNRVHGRGRAARLVGGNMAVRRDLLMQYQWDEDRRFQAMEREGVPDVTNSGGCDEEGLYQIFKWMGYEQVVVPEARVMHEHYYDRRAFFRQAYFGGGSAAHLVWKYRLWHRWDILPLIATYATMGLCLIDVRIWPASAGLLAIWLAAIVFNELFRKNKTFKETVLTLPLVTAYYHVRTFAYLREMIRLWTGGRRMERVSKKEILRRVNEGDGRHG